MRSSYAKFWVTMLNDEWFTGLSCSARGFWMQLILLAKERGDTGRITVRSYSALAELLGCDDSSASKNVREFALASKVIVRTESGKYLSLELVNYEYYQRLRPSRESWVFNDRAGENSFTTREDNKRAEQIIEDDPEFDEICDYYVEKTGLQIKKLDSYRRLISERGKVYSLEELKEAVDGIMQIPYNLGRNERNITYLAFDLIFRDDAHVERYRQPILRKKRKAEQPSVTEYVPEPIPEVSPERRAEIFAMIRREKLRLLEAARMPQSRTMKN